MTAPTVGPAAAPASITLNGRPPGPPHDAFTQAASARVYNHLLGGFHTFTADRDLADRLTTAVPDLPAMAHANQAFLDRAIRHLLHTGINQILDLGCGLLTHDSVHDTLTTLAPTVRAIHVDLDPIVVAQADHAIHTSPRRTQAAAIHADIGHPQAVLRHPTTGALLDLRQPVAVIATAVLHHLPDDPTPVLAAYRDATAPGSYLILSHPTTEAHPTAMTTLTNLAEQAGIPITIRPRQHIQDLFTGYHLIAPGLTWATRWRPDPDPITPTHAARCNLLAGIGHKP